MAPKRKVGRPTKYRPEFCEQARQLCAAGAIDTELAEFFEISIVTLSAWKAKHPEFVKALKIGKAGPNNRVERALYERAMGYSHPDQKIVVVDGEVRIIDTVKHYPPDPTALIFFLKNRMPKKYRDKLPLEDQTEKPPPIEVNINTVDARKEDDKNG